MILEYLEETSPSPLHPADPLERARHRGWIEFGSQLLNAIGRFYSATDEAAFERERSGLEAMFARLESELGGGPFFAGERFSLVDAVFAPVFRYFDGFDQLGDFGILAGKPKLAAWRKSAGREAVGALGGGRGFSGTADAVLRGAEGRAGERPAGGLNRAVTPLRPGSRCSRRSRLQVA